MAPIHMIDPFRCRMWHLHDRIEMHVSEETCKSEIDSFSRHGQLIPVLGRPLKSDVTHDIELIYGARRLFVARLLNMQLKVELREMSDRDAIVAMDIENRQRRDVSPYERGVSYAQWLREGYFQSQDEIARTLKVSASQVSRLLRLSRLPAVVIQAFSSPRDICEVWGLDLLDKLEDSARRQPIVDVARAIGKGSSRPSAREVYRQLMSASASSRKRHTRVHDEVVKSSSGLPLFRIRHQSKSIALLLPLDQVPPSLVESIRESVAALLEQASSMELKSPAKHRRVDRSMDISRGSTRVIRQPLGVPLVNLGSCAPCAET